MATREELVFADLNALTENQIEAGLAAGVWKDSTKPLVERYLEQVKLSRNKKAR
jgi:hypothetical protein